jgi:diguanylate cyclase (GGDEF)-like protein
VITNIINFGVNKATGTQASKVQITNIASLIACILPIFYGLFFYFSLGSPISAIISFCFVAIYSLSLLLSYMRQYRAAKIWLFMAVMGHAFVLSTQIFSSNSGFHFYYLLLPSCLFLIFDEEEKYTKSVLMLLGLVLFFVCDNYDYTKPLIKLTATSEKIIFSSTMLVVMLEIYLVSSVFSKANAKNETLLQNLARKDALTGLNNRRIFFEIGQEWINHARRYNASLSLIILDIDFFKKINDNYGHNVGDQVLKQVAETLESGVRATDIISRYGGEEFVIVLPETASDHAFKIAQNLRESIEQSSIVTPNGESLKWTASFGVAQCDTKKDSLSELTYRADLALYQAKESGRNKVCLHKDET